MIEFTSTSYPEPLYTDTEALRLFNMRVKLSDVATGYGQADVRILAGGIRSRQRVSIIRHFRFAASL